MRSPCFRPVHVCLVLSSFFFIIALVAPPPFASRPQGMDEYDETRVQAFVCDIVGDEELPEPVVEAAGTIDAITLLYVLSAIAPENHAAVRLQGGSNRRWP